MTSHLMLRPALLTLAIALGGCSLAPTYERPAAPVATDWQVANANGTSAQALDWQTFIVDADLRRPSFSAPAGTSVGLSGYLTKGVSLREVADRTSENFFILFQTARS